MIPPGWPRLARGWPAVVPPLSRSLVNRVDRSTDRKIIGQIVRYDRSIYRQVDRHIDRSIGRSVDR
eukprot:8160409-Alexandrium_andersonii.AAC.1